MMANLFTFVLILLLKKILWATDLPAESSVIGYSFTNWWVLNKTDDHLFQDLKKNDILRIRKVPLDDNLVHTCYEYNVLTRRGNRMHHLKEGTFCYPAVIVTGVRKCSTSALYALLSQIPGASTMEVKENCPFVMKQTLVEYFESLPREVHPGDLIIDGCVDLKGNMKMAIRDFSDWIWSAYNFWCSTSYDPECDESTGWTDAKLHHRSAAAFHDIIQGSINGTAVGSPLKFSKPCEKAATFYRAYGDRLLASVADEASLIIASEQLETNAAAVWARIAAKTGLVREHPKMAQFAKVRYNTQDRLSKGSRPEAETIEAERHKHGRYAISNFEVLATGTRSVLGKCWLPDCQWSSNVTGYSYPSCPTPGETSAEGSRSAGSTTGTATAASARQGYLYRQIAKCERVLNVPSASSHALSHSTNGAGSSGAGSGGAGMGKLLILFNNAESRIRVTSLLKIAIASQGHSVLDLDDPLATPSSTSSSSSSLTTCESADIYVAGLTNVSALTAASAAASAEPKSKQIYLFNVTSIDIGFKSPLESAAGATIASSAATAAVGSKPSPCKGKTLRVERVIFFPDNPLQLLWTEFQKILFKERMSRSSNKVAALTPSIARFNWTRWEVEALQYAVAREHTGVFSSPYNLSNFAALRPQHLKIVPKEDLMYGSNKNAFLTEVLAFMSHVLHGPASQAFVSRLTPDFLACTHAAYFASMKASPELVVRRKEMKADVERVFSSEDFICRLQTRLPSVMYASNMRNITCMGDRAVGQDTTQMCKLRYGVREYLEDHELRMPVGLLANPSKETNDVRLLMEHATGVFSGALTTNYTYRNLFSAEFFCGKRMSLIYTLPKDLTIKLTRSGKPTGSLNDYGKKKCHKGGIDGFSSFLILVRDPMAFIWAQYVRDHCHTTSEASLSVEGWERERDSHRDRDGLKCTGNMESVILNITARYSMEHLLDNEAARRVVALFPSNAYRMTSFEYLMNRGTRIAALEQVLPFLGFTNNALERMACAYSFISQHQAIPVASVTRFMQQHPRITCSVKKMLVTKSFAPFLNMTLLHGFNCSTSASGWPTRGHAHGHKPLPTNI